MKNYLTSETLKLRQRLVKAKSVRTAFRFNYMNTTLARNDVELLM